ncbi:MAG: DNA repair protein [Lachnospiraceae bacterium]
MDGERSYVCIDLKSFYASVECRERGLDPMTTNLVVADLERTEKTICLAVSPAMKAMGVPGRCRVFQIPPGIEYLAAPPRMQLYIQYSAMIYGVYLKYIAKEDIHVYSIDEVFMDVTDYLPLYRMSAKELSVKIMEDVLKSTGIPAAAGIGTNLYLAKIALDITAKHAADHIGILDEETYRRTLWDHRPLTDFWRIGTGIAGRLERLGVRTMGQLAQTDERALYRMFGVDAELLIDHAWGRETVTMADIKAYQPKSTSISSGQVLGCPRAFEEGKLIVKEMVDLLCLELVEKELVTDSVTLSVGYDYRSEEQPDHGAADPSSRRSAGHWAHGTVSMAAQTSSANRITDQVLRLYEEIVDQHRRISRVNLSFQRLCEERYRQYDLFDHMEKMDTAREHRMQRMMLDVKKRFGKNAILKGMDLQEGATTRERNSQIGGHRSGA